MHIAVAGNIGSGKTTLTGMLAKHYGWEPLYESVEDNPYLASFYQDMQRWSFNIQIYFLNSRFRQVLDIRQRKKDVIQDRTIYEDAYIFAPNLHRMELMASRDFENYASLFELMKKFLQPPDLLIYLKADVETLISQILKRGRAYEGDISLSYLENLNKLYNNWIDGYKEGKLLVVDVNKLKFADKIGEDAYNQMIVDSLNVFMAIPQKNETMKLLELHIDQEDFAAYIAKPYFNHFCYFDYDRTKDLGVQIKANANSLLLPPEEAIEVMFLLEVPPGQDHTMFYDIMQYYSKLKSPPVYSVVENPALQRPFLTLSMLYSRKPIEVLEEYNQKNVDNKDAIVQRSINQYVNLQKVAVDMDDEAKRAGAEKGINSEVLNSLRRIGKL